MKKSKVFVQDSEDEESSSLPFDVIGCYKCEDGTCNRCQLMKLAGGKKGAQFRRMQREIGQEEAERGYKNTIFVGNLPFEMQETTLRSLFSLCGTIQSAHVFRLRDYKKVHRSYGFVKFHSGVGVQEALRFNDRVFCARRIAVENAATKKYALFVDNMPKTATKEKVAKAFERFAKEAVTVKQEKNGWSVLIKSDIDRREINRFRSIQVDTTFLNTAYFEPPVQFKMLENDGGTFDLYILQVPYGINENDLMEMFILCGHVQKTILRSQNEIIQGFVNFSSEVSRDFALTFNNRCIDGWDIFLKLTKDPTETEVFNSGSYNEQPEQRKIPGSSNGGSNSNQAALEKLAINDFPLLNEKAITFIVEIGRGCIGVVWKAQTEASKIIAVKKYLVPSKADCQSLWAQMNPNHTNVTKLLFLIANNAKDKICGYGMEYMTDGTVYEALHQSSLSISQRLKYSWIAQAARGLDYLHSIMYIHRDVKPSKMFLTNNYERLCLGDSSLAISLGDGVNGIYGTIEYVAPETFLKPMNGMLDEQDVYSLAICAWEIITRRKPYDHLQRAQLSEVNFALMVVEQNERPLASAVTDLEVREILFQSWQEDFIKRLRMCDIAEFFEKKSSMEAQDDRIIIQTSEKDKITTKSRFAKSVEQFIDDGITTFTINEFSKIEFLGEGGFGKVFKAHNFQFSEVAVKIFKKNWTLDEQRELFHMMKNATHTNIVQFYGVLLQEETRVPIGFVMQYMRDKTVHHALHKNTEEFEDDLRYSWISQAGRALDYLHSRNLVYRDVKPANMLLCDYFSLLRLCDMGTVRQCGCDTISGAMSGTLIYNAPEALSMTNADKYESTADIYSFGISIWEIMARRKPFDHITSENSPIELAWRASKNDERPEMPEFFDSDLRDVLHRSWNKEPSIRPTAAEIVEFFDEIFELLYIKEIGKSKASIRMTTLPAIPPTPRQIGSNEQGGKLDFQIRGAPNEKVHRWVTSTTIRITNLEQPTEEQVRRYFSYHGLVVDSELDPSGTSAFVRYQFEHNAFQAIEKTNMSYFLNGTKKMRVEQYTS